MDKTTKVEIDIPFSTERYAEIAYHVLRVDIEPERSKVTKTLSHKTNILHCVFESTLPKQLRTAVNSYFEKIDLILETCDSNGSPVSDSYSYFQS